jgi:hypothetical protein
MLCQMIGEGTEPMGLCFMIGSGTDSMLCPVLDRGGNLLYALSLVLDPEQLAAGGCCVLLEGSQGCSDR